MAVVALEPYEFASADSVDKFHGNQLLYICWDDHLMFCAPFALSLSPAMHFGEIQKSVIPSLFGYHPDQSRIDWRRVEWFKSGKPWKPDPDQSLSGNGLRHKDVLRFRTPGLTGIKGSHS
jgi:phenol hydroxylase P4 protein